MKRIALILIMIFLGCTAQQLKDYDDMHKSGGPYDTDKCYKARVYYEKYGTNEYYVEMRDACKEVTFDKLIYQYLVKPQEEKEKKAE